MRDSGNKSRMRNSHAECVTLTQNAGNLAGLSISEMKQLASVVFQLTINLQGDFNNGLIFRMKLLVSLVPYLPRKGK